MLLKSKRFFPTRRKATFFLSILLLFFVSALQAQTGQISGRIVDTTTNLGIPRVSVLVKGSNRGTVTDENGYYKIDAAQGEVLVFTSQGYTMQESTVSGSAVNINFVPENRQLSEVVVIGYGQKSRRLLTESIGTVTSKEIQKLPVASADAAIQGRVSGVQITNVDGTPGSPVAIRIRGVGTVGPTQPLFVIDGVQVGDNSTGGRGTNPLATINPADIESISVLKDASSAAIYGMRAANGVVLITTKRGRSGRPRVSFDAYYGIQQFPKRLEVNNTQQYVALAQEAINNRNAQDNLQPGQTGFRVLHPDLLPGTPNSVLGINTDWQEAAINKNAPVSNYNVGISGGTDNSNFFLSFGYFKQEAVTRRWDLERYSVRANSDYKIGNRLKIGQTLGISFQKVNRGMNGGGDGFYVANNLSMPPFFKIYDDENKIPGNRYGFNGNSNVAGFTIGNQFALNEIVLSREDNYRLIGGVYGELEILKDLRFKSAASIDLNFGRSTGFQPGFTDKEIGYGREVNNASDSRGQGYTQVFTNTLSYDKMFGEHSFNVLGGIEYQKLRGNNLSYTGNAFQSTDPLFYQVVSNGSPGTAGYENAGSGAFQRGYASYFGRLSYNFKERYLLTATVRRDGTSRFAEKNRWGTFPAISAAWRISEEAFFKGVPFISDLKIRGSYGHLGNAETSEFAYISRVRFTPQYPIGGTPAQAPIPSNLPNAELFWETVKSTDIGFDASFFNNKVSLLATYYKRNTTDFLLGLPIPFTSGFSSTDVNVGLVRNTGFEFELGYNTSVFKKVNVNLSGNLTTVKNRLVSLTNGVEEFSGGDYRTAVGYPIGYFYGYQTAGIYQNTTETAAALPDAVAGANASNRPRPGDIRFVDNNSPAGPNRNGKQFSDSADGRITPADRTMIGKTIPDFFYGLNINANYRALDLSVLFQGVSGIQVYNSLRRSLENLGGPGRNQSVSTQNRWTGEGTSNTMPRAVDGDPYNNNRFSDRWVEDAGFFRLKNIQVGYSVPQALLAKTKAFKSARIYVGATNLFVITDYTGFDPEVMTFGNVRTATAAGTDQGSTPQPRTYQAGLQFNF